MRSYTSIILMSLLSISLLITSQEIKSGANNDLSSFNSADTVEAQKTTETKPRNRGSGRRSMFSKVYKVSFIT